MDGWDRCSGNVIVGSFFFPWIGLIAAIGYFFQGKKEAGQHALFWFVAFSVLQGVVISLIVEMAQ